MRNKNPFEVFGLSPKIVKELDEEALYKLVKSVYRVLQLIYHPDRGGDPEKSLELNKAFELLNLEKNPESFKEYRKKYIARLSRKTLQSEIEELRTQNRRLKFYNELLKEKFWQYLETGFETIENFFSNNKIIKLKIFDIVSHINFSDIRSIKKQIYFKELILTKEFILKKRSYEKYFIKIQNYKFLGTIKREYIEPWVLLERDPKEEKFILKNYMNKETFIKECLVYLNPKLNINTYVFFYYPDDFQKVYLEGVIINTEEIKNIELSEILEMQTIKSSITTALAEKK
ncbi:MAG: hypothetical protein DRP29_04935 [Thermodesulfobacteriota bacterium]|nr:MAG: hypothetical protein DRP29_04935 [Thermodesulfobacteriota bacterium]RLG09705.1 MAG: hypothetical protein DRN73_09440 [Candidatus Pacearchaeota archaeon]